MNKIKYDITENRQEKIRYKNFKNTNNPYTFYYDETNNIRKFIFKRENGKLNISIEDIRKNFVLGGVMYEGTRPDLDIHNLKKKINLQKNSSEIKLKHLVKGDFLASIKSRKLETFLLWLIEYDLYIHYQSIDIFYWSIIDIIESMMNKELLSSHNYKLLLENHWLIKSIFFEVIRVDLENFLKILYKYEYPNIKREQAIEFLDELKHFIEKNKTIFIKQNKNIDPSIFDFIDFILNLLDEVKGKELIFIMDEKDNVLINSFFNFYLSRLDIFIKSTHVFDREVNIEDEFKVYDICDGTNSLNHYSFKDSTEDILIQASDITVGILGKFFTYINNVTFEEIDKLSLNEQQTKNIILLTKLIKRSEEKSLALIQSVQSFMSFEKMSFFLNKFL